MPNQNLPQELHDRVTRGESLSCSEQAQLAAWYAEQDQREAELLARPDDLAPLGVLQAKFDEAISQMRDAARQIEIVVSENEAIRREIAALEDRLARSAAVQSA